MRCREILNLMLIVAFIAPTAEGADRASAQIGPRDIVIEIDPAMELENSAPSTINVLKACSKFGSFLTQNRGIWGSGPFRTAICRLEPGSEANSDDKTSSAVSEKDWTWKLDITVEKEMKRFEIFYRDKDGKASKESEYFLKTEVDLMNLLTKPKFASLIAAYLSVGLPMRTAILGSVLKKNGSVILPGYKKTTLEPSKDPVQIYALSELIMPGIQIWSRRER